MSRRRLCLLSTALLMLLVDGAWLFRQATEPNASITYVGLDSMTLVVPERLHAARWDGRRWDIDPLAPLRTLPRNWGVGIPDQPVAFISMAPEPSFQRSIGAIRDLKRRHVCNVLIRELAEAQSPSFGSAERPERTIGVRALTLCDHSLGDAGFFGTLPADRALHLR